MKPELTAKQIRGNDYKDVEAAFRDLSAPRGDQPTVVDMSKLNLVDSATIQREFPWGVRPLHDDARFHNFMIACTERFQVGDQVSFARHIAGRGRGRSVYQRGEGILLGYARIEGFGLSMIINGNDGQLYRMPLNPDKVGDPSRLKYLDVTVDGVARISIPSEYQVEPFVKLEIRHVKLPAPHASASLAAMFSKLDEHTAKQFVNSARCKRAMEKARVSEVLVLGTNELHELTATNGARMIVHIDEGENRIEFDLP